MSVRNKAVFLDRDGTLIEDVGILTAPGDIRIFPDTITALRKLGREYLLFVVTNQSAVAKGTLTMKQVHEVNTHLDEMLALEGIVIRAWYVCPHGREDNCACIKPKSRFILEASDAFNLDLKRSFVLGDHPHDTLTANELGVFGLYLLTGHGGKHLSDLPADKLVFHRLIDAADWILRHPDNAQDIARQITKGAKCIQMGKVVAFPTETVYGLGADAFNAAAIARVFEIKKRPLHNPLIVHISNLDQLNKLVVAVPENAQQLIEAFWPGPLTIVLPKRSEVPDVVTGGNLSVAIRMPANPIALELINRSGTPLAAPSANAFSCTSPTTAQHVIDQLGTQCDAVIDGGACRVGVESTVISFTGPNPVILRPGGISSKEIEAVIGTVQIMDSHTTKDVESPGLMPNHYAPRTPLRVFSEIPDCYENVKSVGVLLFRETGRTFTGIVEILSRSGDVNEAAANLYAAIRRLDALELDEIVVERAPAYGSGSAINDRLAKASRGRSV